MRIHELIDGFRILIADAVLEGRNDRARSYAASVAILRDELLTSDELVAAARATAEYHRAAREAAPPHEDAPAVEAGAMTQNHQQEEQIVSTVTPRIASPEELHWLINVRDVIDAAEPHAVPVLDELGYPWDPDRLPTDVLSAIDTAREHRGYVPDFDTALPAPPDPPEWAVMSTVVPSLDGQVLVTHSSRPFDLVHIERQRAYQVYAAEHPAGTIAYDNTEFVLPRNLVTAGAVPAGITRRLTAALAAALDELENAPRTVRRPVDVDEHLRELEN